MGDGFHIETTNCFTKTKNCENLSCAQIATYVKNNFSQFHCGWATASTWKQRIASQKLKIVKPFLAWNGKGVEGQDHVQTLLRFDLSNLQLPTEIAKKEVLISVHAEESRSL